MVGKGTQSLTRALLLLELVADIHDLDGLIKETGLTRSTIYRLLTTLVEYGYIRHVPYTGYYLGPRLIELGFKVYENLHLPVLARPFLEKLAQQTQETVHMAVLNGNTITYIEKVVGSRQLQMASTIGMVSPVQSTALGKCLISRLPENTWYKYFDASFKKTPATITDYDEFVSTIRKVSQDGFAFDCEENEVGIMCIASPVFDVKGSVVASISISGATVYYTQDNIESHRNLVVETAKLISMELGWKET